MTLFLSALQITTLSSKSKLVKLYYTLLQNFVGMTASLERCTTKIMTLLYSIDSTKFNLLSKKNFISRSCP